MQKKLFALALGTLLFGGSLAAIAATQSPQADPQACCCCEDNAPCCGKQGDAPCCDKCLNEAAR